MLQADPRSKTLKQWTDIQIWPIRDPFIALINSYGIKDYKEALQSQVSRDLGRHWPVYSHTKIHVVSKYGLFSLNRITKYKLFAHVIFCGT